MTDAGWTNRAPRATDGEPARGGAVRAGDRGERAVRLARRFVASARFAAASVAEAGGEAYLYHFACRPPVAGDLGAFHGLELPYVFGNSALTLDVTEGADGELSAAMMRYWVAFAAGGDPNGAAEGANSAGASAPSDASSDAALPVWPLYDPATDQCLVLDREIGAAPAPYRRACDLADRLRAARGALRQVQVSRGVNNDR